MPSPPTSRLPVPRSWDEFEDIVSDVLRRVWSDPYVHRNGRVGQAQNGVDILGRPQHLNATSSTPRFCAAQCKLTSSLSLQTIQADIAKAQLFSPTPTEFLVMTTALRDTALQQAVRCFPWPFRVEIWFWEDISLALAGHADLLKKHYPGWVSGTIGTGDVLDRLLTSNPDDFQYDDNAGVYLHHADVKLRLVLDRELAYDRFDEPWVWKFPNPSASKQMVYLEYDGARVRSFYFVWVDGHRYLLPLPKAREDLRVTKLQHHLALILGHPHYGYHVDQGLAKAGIAVDPTLAETHERPG